MLSSRRYSPTAGLLRLGCGSKDRSGVGIHYLVPVVNVAGMIGMRLAADAETCTDEACRRLGYALFLRILIITEPLAELPLQRCGADV